MIPDGQLGCKVREALRRCAAGDPVVPHEIVLRDGQRFTGTLVGQTTDGNGERLVFLDEARGRFRYVATDDLLEF